jgi:predicted ArsR family transcriptional regulator
VKQTGVPCRLEEQFYKEIFEAALDRVSYIPDGSAACTYEINVDEMPTGEDA